MESISVMELFSKLSLEDYLDAFINAGFDIETIPMVSVENLKEIVPSLSTRILIVHKIRTYFKVIIFIFTITIRTKIYLYRVIQMFSALSEI